MERRDFLKSQAAGTVTLSLLDKMKSFGIGKFDRNNSGGKVLKMKMNNLGKTGMEVSNVGFGGIVVMNAEPAQAANAVSDAIEAGVNYFDVAPSYGDAEIKLGPALEPFRKNVYLACKSHLRDAKGTKELLDKSLENLKTDYFDV